MTKSQENIQYLFIAGCARSGTTALTRLLNHHPKLAIGVELFNQEYNGKKSAFTPDLFLSRKFKSFLKREKKDQNKLKYLGDKFPAYYKDYGKIFDQFEEAKVLFIFRNIFDVSQSFKARMLDDESKWNKGPKRAVEEWNQSLSLTLDAINDGRNIIPISYEHTLFKPSGQLTELLEVNYLKIFQTKYGSMTKVAKTLDRERQNLLNNKEKAWIMEHSDFDSYKALLKLTKARIS